MKPNYVPLEPRQQLQRTFNTSGYAYVKIDGKRFLEHRIIFVFPKPQRIEADRVDSTLEHRMARIEQYGGRVLRVVVNTSSKPPRIVTVFFDRGMRNKI